MCGIDLVLMYKPQIKLLSITTVLHGNLRVILSPLQGKSCGSIVTIRTRCPDVWGQTKPHLLCFSGSQFSASPCFFSRPEYTFSSSVKSATEAAGEHLWLLGWGDLGLLCMVTLNCTQEAELTAQVTRYTRFCVALCLVLSIPFLFTLCHWQFSKRTVPRAQIVTLQSPSVC